MGKATVETVALLGAGKIADAMVAGWIASGEIPPHRIRVTNRSDDRKLEEMERRYGVTATRDRRRLLAGADLVVVACKPADVPAALEAAAPYLEPGATVLSVAAGVRTHSLRALLGHRPEVVRAMPNTACRVRQSATAVCAAEGCPEEALARAEGAMALLGSTYRLPEDLLDAVTALAGSGPAYAYLLAEAMLDAAEELGIHRAIARQLVAATLRGAGTMLMVTEHSPAELRLQVTSPGGTTAAAMQVLIEEADVPGAIRRAVRRAAQRAAELAAAWAAGAKG